MQLFIARYLFICFMFLFHNIVGKRMWNSPSYFHETMDIIDMLFRGVDNYRWKVRAINLMNSYAKENTHG